MLSLTISIYLGSNILSGTDVFGKIKPCCAIKSNNKWDDQTIEEYSQSDMLRQFRKEMLEGGGPLVESNCEICIEQEKHSPESHRRTYNKYFFS